MYIQLEEIYRDDTIDWVEVKIVVNEVLRT